jgi:hypothetical protein
MTRKEAKKRSREARRVDQASYDDVTRRLLARIDELRARAQRAERRESS